MRFLLTALLLLAFVWRFATAAPVADSQCCHEACAMPACAMHACPACDLAVPAAAAAPVPASMPAAVLAGPAAADPAEFAADMWRPPPAVL